MDIWQLTVFHKVIELKSFSNAAEALHISQPTVSAHIKNLEEHFDCILVDRVDKNAVPTKAGKLLFNYACRIIRLKEETENAIASLQGNFQGKLSIGASTIPGGHLLPRFIGDFRKDFSQIKVSVFIADSKKIADSILSGQIEMGIVGTKYHHKKILHEKLIDDEMFLIIPAGHRWSNRKKVTVEELKAEPFIIREQGSGTLKTIQESFSKQSITSDQLNIVAEMGNTTAVIQGIKSSLGISILSPIAIKDDLLHNTLTTLKIEGLEFRRHFYLIRHSDRTPSNIQKAFTSHLKQAIRSKE